MIAFFEDTTFSDKVVKKAYTGVTSSKLFNELIDDNINFLSLNESEDELKKELSLCKRLDKYQLKLLIIHHANEMYKSIKYDKSQRKFTLKDKLKSEVNGQLFDYDTIVVLTSNGICTLDLNNNRQSTFKIIK